MKGRWRLRWRAWSRRAEFEGDLAAELAFHLAERRDALIEEGLPADAAARRARIELGMTESHKEECRRARGLQLFDGAAADVRYAARSLRRSPGFTTTALLVLGVALGANALLCAAYRAYTVARGATANGGLAVEVVAQGRDGGERDAFSRDAAAAVATAGESVLASVHLRTEVRAALREGPQPAAYGSAVSAGYFSGALAAPRLGRVLLASEDVIDAGTPAVVLSDSGWKRLLQSDSHPLGRTLVLSGTSFTVVGVLGPEANPAEALQPQFWISLASYEAMRRRAGEEPPAYRLGGELRPGIAAARATAALAGVSLRRVVAAAGEEPAELRMVERRGLLAAGDARGIRLAALPVFVAFGLVLFVACANLANLSLARGAAREREIAIRMSLGAGRWRVVRQLLTESLALSLLAAGLGLAAAAGAVAPLQRLAMSPVYDLGVDPTPIALDAGTVLATVVLALGAGMAFGLGPALRVTRRDLVEGAKRADAGDAFGSRPLTVRRSLLVLQVAASLVLLVLASSVARNAMRSSTLPVGFSPERVLDAGSSRPSAELRRLLATLPGVGAVATTSSIPLAGNFTSQPVRAAGTMHGLGIRAVDEHYFATLGIPLRRGRVFSAAEAIAAARVMVVSAATARRLWPDGDAIGRELEVLEPAPGSPGAPAGRYEVVGVSGDVLSDWFFRGTDAAAAYVPAAFSETGAANLLVRVDGDLERVRGLVRSACAEASATAICEPVPLSRWLALQRAPFEVAALAAAALGAVAAAISCIGLFGSVAFQVTRRRRELGVRMAIGASPTRIVATVLASAARAVFVGIAIGLPVCAALSAFLGARLPGIVAFDGRSYGTVPAVLAAVALLAASLAAARATRIAPPEAMQEG